MNKKIKAILKKTSAVVRRTCCAMHSRALLGSLPEMNKRGIFKTIFMLIILLALIGLYFYTDQTKEIIGMMVAGWEPVKVNLAQKTITLQLSNVTNITPVP